MFALSLQTQFFLVFSRSHNFLVKARRGRSGSRNWGNQAFSVKLYTNPTRSWALFNVCCCCRCQRLQFPWFYFLPLWSLGFLQNSFLNRVFVLELSVVIHCCYIGALLMWCWGAGERLASANLVMKSQFPSGLESLDCDIRKCFLGLFSTLMWERKAKRAGVV